MQISEMTAELLSKPPFAAVDVGTKVFHNLTATWGYFKMEFKMVKDTKIEFGVLKVDIVLYPN